MLSVDLRLHGGERGAPLLGTLFLQNDSRGDEHVGGYDVRLELTPASAVAAGATLVGRVEGFDRSRGAWALVGEALAVLRLPGGRFLCE